MNHYPFTTRGVSVGHIEAEDLTNAGVIGTAAEVAANVDGSRATGGGSAKQQRDRDKKFLYQVCVSGKGLQVSFNHLTLRITISEPTPIGNKHTQPDHGHPYR